MIAAAHLNVFSPWISMEAHGDSWRFMDTPGDSWSSPLHGAPMETVSTESPWRSMEMPMGLWRLHGDPWREAEGSRAMLMLSIRIPSCHRFGINLTVLVCNSNDRVRFEVWLGWGGGGVRSPVSDVICRKTREIHGDPWRSTVLGDLQPVYMKTP